MTPAKAKPTTYQMPSIAPLCGRRSVQAREVSAGPAGSSGETHARTRPGGPGVRWHRSRGSLARCARRARRGAAGRGRASPGRTVDGRPPPASGRPATAAARHPVGQPAQGRLRGDPAPGQDGPEAAQVARVEQAHHGAAAARGPRRRSDRAPAPAAGAPRARSRRAARPGSSRRGASRPAVGQRRAERRRVDVGGDVPLADVAVRRVRGAVGDVAAVGHERAGAAARPVQVGGRARRSRGRGRGRRPAAGPPRPPTPSTAGPDLEALALDEARCRRAASVGQALRDDGVGELAEDLLEGAVAADRRRGPRAAGRRGSPRGGPGRASRNSLARTTPVTGASSSAAASTSGRPASAARVAQLGQPVLGSARPARSARAVRQRRAVVPEARPGSPRASVPAPAPYSRSVNGRGPSEPLPRLVRPAARAPPRRSGGARARSGSRRPRVGPGRRRRVVAAVGMAEGERHEVGERDRPAPGDLGPDRLRGGASSRRPARPGAAGPGPTSVWPPRSDRDRGARRPPRSARGATGRRPGPGAAGRDAKRSSGGGPRRLVRRRGDGPAAPASRRPPRRRAGRGSGPAPPGRRGRGGCPRIEAGGRARRGPLRARGACARREAARRPRSSTSARTRQAARRSRARERRRPTCGRRR